MLDIDMQSPNEFTVNLLTEQNEKQFFEMYFKIYECLQVYIFFHFFVLSAVFAFLMGNIHTHTHTIALSYAKWQIGYISLKTI